jgi:hypothetical protein
MSLQPENLPDIPEETARVARSLFPTGNRYMWLRDELGAIYTDEQFASLYPKVGQLAEQPWRLAVVSIMQYMENYTDRQAAEAMKTRIDWKYALSLELTDPGFDFSLTLRIPQPFDQGTTRRGIAYDPIGTLSGAWLDQGTGKTANGFNACGGSHSRDESIGMRWGNPASGVGASGGRCARLAAYSCCAGLVRSI